MLDTLANFHFAQPYYFLLLLFIPVIVIYVKSNKSINNVSLYYKQYKALASLQNLKSLLKFNPQEKQNTKLKLLILFIILIIFSLAKPRWQYHEVEITSNTNNIIFLLDSSSSMNVKDLAPNRFAFSKEKILTIVNNINNSRISLIAFTDIPHVISPLTKDLKAVRGKLNNLTTSNFTRQGTNINEAIRIADNLYKDFSGDKNSIILLTDGDFDNNITSKLIKNLNNKNLNFITLATGTKIGGPVYVKNKILTYEQQNVYSKLQIENLEKLNKTFNGKLINATQNDHDIAEIINLLDIKNSQNNQEKDKVKIWQEAFYIFLLPALLVLLFYTRYFLCFLFLLISFPENLKANIFLNNEQQAKQDFAAQNYKSAYEKFSTPYNKGVSAYKNNDFETAAKEFSKINTDDIERKFNLANSYFMLNDFNSAIKEYKEILAINNNDTKTKHNLKIAKAKLKEQQQKDSKQHQDNKKAENSNNEPKTQDKEPAENDNQTQKNQAKPEEQNNNKQGDDSNSQNTQSNNELDKENADQSGSPNKKQDNDATQDIKGKKSNEAKDNYEDVFDLIEDSTAEIMQRKIQLIENNNKTTSTKKPW